ncbi:hypothetical protein IDJ75_12950 [Mucilaginibacter rigui]|uniref:Uncharacterized protein n=1 Tax=Mucilaginibacter rigui TaxID=534635 RepID=A0ABR7X6R2_9SPHI|nr:hypothetical protein [Mucilaginibacter rigui]MBD1386191.1 hypothetical protein [Mucilaginibacter rigui]
MKKIYTCLLAVALFTACKKADTEDRIIIEPPYQKLIANDTLTSGQLFGLTIGQTSAELYAKIQQVQAAEKIGGLSVVNNIYTSIDSLKTRLLLYKGIFMDEAVGTSTGVQLSFENNRVKTIFLNNGAGLTRWPVSITSNNAIAIGDPVDEIYQKLVNIKKDPLSAKKLERLSIFFKDTNKPYDPQMSASPQWYFVSTKSAKRYMYVTLNFTTGKLVSIYTAEFETQ